MKTNKILQSGRSMVEMLGTLAIIGVLSIGGIAGYSYGMDKHKANQTINDVMLIGIDIVSQISQGITPTLLSGWGSKTSVGYDMSLVQSDEDELYYGLRIEGVPSRVCKIVGDGLKSTVAVYVENVDANVEEDLCDASELNAMEFFFPLSNDVIRCTTSSDCDENEVCMNKVCAPIEPELSVWKPEGGCKTDDDCGQCGYCDIGSEMPCMALMGGDCKLENGEDGMCRSGKCLPNTACNYDTNECTGKNEYCAVLSGTYLDSLNCKNPFTNNKTGICATASFKPLIVDGQEYLLSTGFLLWPDANAACKAVNRQLVGSDDLIVKSTNTLTALGNSLHDLYYIWINDTGRYIDIRSTELKNTTCNWWLHAVCK